MALLIEASIPDAARGKEEIIKVKMEKLRKKFLLFIERIYYIGEGSIFDEDRNFKCRYHKP